MIKKLKILITASQTVFYRQVVEMTPVEWERFKRTPEESIGDEADGWLDKRDVAMADDIESESVSAIVVDAKNEAVAPTDEYGGTP